MVDISKLDIAKNGAIIFVTDTHVIQRRLITVPCPISIRRNACRYEGKVFYVDYKNRRYELGEEVK